MQCLGGGDDSGDLILVLNKDTGLFRDVADNECLAFCRNTNDV